MVSLAQAAAAATAAAKAAPHPGYSLNEVLSPYVGVFYAAFLVAILLTPILRKVALANGVVDWPDKRKAHAEPVAYLGGLAVFLGWLAGIIACLLVTPHTIDIGPFHRVQFPLSIIIGATIITLVGLIDDVYGVSPRVKVGGQLLAAALLVWPLFGGEPVGTELVAEFIRIVLGFFGFDGAQVAQIPFFDSVTYWLGAIVVAAMVLGGTNAANLLDGLDGLATGVTSIVAVGFTVIAVSLAMGLYSDNGQPYSIIYDPVRVVMCLALLGAVLGFLPWNFNPANIFMGDAGSLLLGYLCITTILLFAENGDPALVMTGLIVFALPILDTALALVRRKLRGQGLFDPDKQHLHHQLIKSGMSVKQAVITLYGLALGFAALGASLVFIRMRFVAAIFMFVFGFIVVMAYKVGHRQYVASLPDSERPKLQIGPSPKAGADRADGPDTPTEGDADAEPAGSNPS